MVKFILSLVANGASKQDAVHPSLHGICEVRINFISLYLDQTIVEIIYIFVPAV